jgi:hypothetical protein
VVEDAPPAHEAPGVPSSVGTCCRQYAALAAVMWNVSPYPGSGTSTSPFWYQSNNGPTWPSGSAMNPSRDVEKLAKTAMILLLMSRWTDRRRTRWGR